MPPESITYAAFFMLGIIACHVARTWFAEYQRLQGERHNIDMMSRAEKMAAQQYEMFQKGAFPLPPSAPKPPAVKQK